MSHKTNSHNHRPTMGTATPTHTEPHSQNHTFTTDLQLHRKQRSAHGQSQWHTHHRDNHTPTQRAAQSHKVTFAHMESCSSCLFPQSQQLTHAWDYGPAPTAPSDRPFQPTNAPAAAWWSPQNLGRSPCSYPSREAEGRASEWTAALFLRGPLGNVVRKESAHTRWRLVIRHPASAVTWTKPISLLPSPYRCKGLFRSKRSLQVSLPQETTFFMDLASPWEPHIS